MKAIYNRTLAFWLHSALLLLLVISLFSIRAAASTKEESVDKNIVDDRTPAEPANSDLSVLKTATKLDARRWIQSFAYDSRYYYYIQMTNPYKGHLRITRVKYTGLGRNLQDHMDLKYFGHATNLDTSVYAGKTYLWTGSNAASGSDVSRAVTCFRYKKNKTLYHHGSYTYRIPKGRWGKYVTNVYPAVNEKSTRLAVRFTYKGKQYYQVYKLTKGTKINNRKPLKQAALPNTAGDFQGFDLYGSSTIYTIEGSPSSAFLKAYNKAYKISRAFQPTIIRTWNLSNSTGRKKQINGASALPFREPEGIKAAKGRSLQIMFVSFRLTDQRCNIYSVK